MRLRTPVPPAARPRGTARLGIAVAVVAGSLLFGACSDDEPSDDPAAALADRVSTVLDDDGSAVLERLAEGDAGVTAEELGDADVLCPRVTDPDPGDRATCRVTAGGEELEVDVEFRDGGGMEVVAVAVAP